MAHPAEGKPASDPPARRPRGRARRIVVWTLVVCEVAGVFSAVEAVMSTRTAQGAIAWSVSLVTLPVVAVPAYWVLGRSRFQGYVTARRQATVSSKITGKVQEVLIEEGMAVEAGQVLAYLDDANVRRSHDLALAQLAAQRTTAKETEALLREARANLRRTENLVARDLASDQELDRARAAASSARSFEATPRTSAPRTPTQDRM